VAAIVVYFYVFYEAFYFCILECLDEEDYDDYDDSATADIIVVDSQDIPMNEYPKDDYID
jgi:hypothetical protein